MLMAPIPSHYMQLCDFLTVCDFYKVRHYKQLHVCDGTNESPTFGHALDAHNSMQRKPGMAAMKSLSVTSVLSPAMFC